MLNNLQKMIVVFGVLCLGFLSIYLPWTQKLNSNELRMERPAGYHFVFAPPQARPNSVGGFRVSFSQALPPIVFVVVATVAGVIITRRRSPRSLPPLAADAQEAGAHNSP